jgi:hypothetical protein
MLLYKVTPPTSKQQQLAMSMFSQLLLCLIGAYTQTVGMPTRLLFAECRSHYRAIVKACLSDLQRPCGSRYLSLSSDAPSSDTATTIWDLVPYAPNCSQSCKVSTARVLNHTPTRVPCLEVACVKIGWEVQMHCCLMVQGRGSTAGAPPWMGQER